MELVFPYIVRQMLNVEIPQKNLDELFYWAGILVVLYLINFGLLFAINYYGRVMSSGIENDMRRDLFAHMEKMSFRFLIMPAQVSCCRVLRAISWKSVS